MRFRNLALVFLVLALAMPAMAQEQRASIEGVVKDASGAVLPGVTVEAKNLAVGVGRDGRDRRHGCLPFPGPGGWDLRSDGIAPGLQSRQDGRSAPDPRPDQEG